MSNPVVYVLLAPSRWLKKAYAWTIHWANTPQAPYALFGVAFIESSFFPIPPDVLLIAMVLADRSKWLRNAAICTAGSVCGAFFGYSIGWFFYETAGKWIVDTYNLHEVVTMLGQKYSENAFFTIFTAAFTPIPYKAITITAGLFKIPLLTLAIASIIGRAGRFFLVAGTLKVAGKKVADSIEKYFDIFSMAFVLLLVAGFFFLKYAFK